MKYKILLFFCFLFLKNNSQAQIDENKNKINRSFSQLEVAIPLARNLNRNTTNLNGTKNESWFIPNGISAKYGYGIQYYNWVAISIHSGIDWNINSKLVAVPVFSNLRFSAGLKNDSRINLQLGLGNGFAIGRGNLSNIYKRISIGYENTDNVIFFIEVSDYKFQINNQYSVGSLNVGFAMRNF